MKARLWPLATLVLGLATLAAFIALGQLPEVVAAYEMSARAGAVSAFQRAETMSDLVILFGNPPDAAQIAAMDALNTLDLWAFTPLYTLFLSAAALMLGGSPLKPLALAAILFAVLGGAADAVETWTQLRVTANWEEASAYLPIAPWHWLKYGALGCSAFAIAGVCLLSERKRWILGVIALAPLPLVLAAYADALPVRWFSAGFGAHWLSLLGVSIIELVRAKDSPA